MNNSVLLCSVHRKMSRFCRKSMGEISGNGLRIKLQSGLRPRISQSRHPNASGSQKSRPGASEFTTEKRKTAPGPWKDTIHVQVEPPGSHFGVHGLQILGIYTTWISLFKHVHKKLTWFCWCTGQRLATQIQNRI